MLSGLTRLVAVVMAALALACVAPSLACAQNAAPNAPVRKVALVIGNAEYDGNVLDNPEHDAAAVTERLTALGFTVTAGMNLGRAGMGSLIAQFVDGVSDGDLVLIFYAGHGVEVGGQTYLIPVDARMLSPSAPRFEGVPVEQLWSFAKRPYGTVILFDACRDSPFLGRVRGDVAGAHAASTPPNTLLLFSSSTGRPASDGTSSGHSLFTTALLDALKSPDTSLDQVVRATTRAVRAVSSDAQVPQRYGGLDQDFAFDVRAVPPPAPPPPAPLVLAATPPPVSASPPPTEIAQRAKPEPEPEPEPQPVRIAVASTPTPLRSIPAGAPTAPPAPPPAVASPSGTAGFAVGGPAPPKPVLHGVQLETVADIAVPASFCTVEEKYAFIAARQKPAGEAAMRNNVAAIAYKAELNALYVKYRDATAAGTYSGEIMDELKRVGALADQTFAKAGETQRLFDVIMAVPVARCRA